MAYVLLHVLEISVPGKDLDAPCCEVTLGDTAAPCSVPSTLFGENVLLPVPDVAEPVIYVRAKGGEQVVGVVVVPVQALVPLEIWNVWYAMDDSEEKPAEETPKMHLLLEHVPAEAAAQESKQARDLRAQDFLLRALQQLNSALEAKVQDQSRSGRDAVLEARLK